MESATVCTEKRTRVFLHLPCKGGARAKAFKRVIDYLRAEWTSKPFIGGWTMSQPGSPVFSGYWLESAGSQPAEDHLSLVFFDYLDDYLGERPAVDEVTELIGKKIHEIYAEKADSYQKVIWLVHHPVHVTKIEYAQSAGTIQTSVAEQTPSAG